MKLYIEINAGNTMLVRSGVVYKKIYRNIEAPVVTELRDKAIDFLKGVQVLNEDLFSGDVNQTKEQLSSALRILNETYSNNLSFFVGGNSYVKLQLKE